MSRFSSGRHFLVGSLMTFAVASAPIARAAEPAAIAPVAPPATAPVAPSAALPTTSPFDAYDPEIRKIAKLDWRPVDFAKLDVPTRASAMFALNRMLDIAEAKADARADLLVAYLDKDQLGSAYLDATVDADKQPGLSFEDLEKVAAAFVLSPEGQQKFGDEFRASPAKVQATYIDLYEKTCRRKYDDVAEKRVQVRLMGKFLESRGKFPEFLAWAHTETQRREKEHEAELAQAAHNAATQQAEDARLAQARAQELAMRRLDYQYELARQAATQQGSNNNNNPPNNYGNYGYNGDDWTYPWAPTVYYYNPVWRDAARARIGNAFNRWGGGQSGGAGAARGAAWRRR